MTTEERRRRRFSEPFKKEQVRLIETGELKIIEVSRLYEVRPYNVSLWVKKYGSKELPPTIIVTDSKDYNRIGDLEKQIADLKQIIANQHIELISQTATIELAEQKLGKGFEKK